MHSANARLTSTLCLLAGRSLASAQCQFDFEGGFAFAGASAEPRAGTLFDDGSGLKLYLAGPRLVGPTRVDGFFSFDGSNWAPVGGGVDGFIRAMTVHDGAIYVCGDFRSVDGLAVNRVARWDGSAWSALGDGLAGSILWSIAGYENDLYVGRTSSPLLAKWDGVTWSSVQDLEMSAVTALCAHNGRLYVSGDLRIPGAEDYENIASWDGATWSSVGGGFNGNAYVLSVIDGDLYAAGNITRAGTAHVESVARWDGQSWHAVGDGLFGSIVTSLQRFQGVFYVGGTLFLDDKIFIRRVARLDGDTWQSVIIAGQSVSSLSAFANRMYVGGSFSSIEGVPASNFAAFDGLEWSRVFPGIVGQALSVAEFGNQLFASGSIRLIGDVPVRGIARFDGVAWQDASEGLPSGVVKLIVLDGSLYGILDIPVPGTSQILQWNGTQWTVLPHEFNGEVHDLTAYNGDWVATGTFTVINGVACRKIGRFDGSAWHPLGSGLGQSDFSTDFGYTLENHDSRLIVGGYFARAGGVSASNLAAWNGSTWAPVAPAISHTPTGVRALLSDRDSLFVGGQFTHAGGQPVNNVARWDGERWHSLGGGAPGAVVRELLKLGQSLIATGDFISIGGLNVNGLARWDGWAWHELDDSYQGGASALAVYSGRLYLGSGDVDTGSGVSVAFASAPIPSLTADLDSHGDTDLQDLATLLSSFGADDGPGDLDGDGDTDLQDLSILLADFGAICP